MSDIEELKRAAELARPVPAAAPQAPPPAATLPSPPASGRKRLTVLVILLAALSGGGYWGWNWYTQGRFIVSTDDA